MLQNEESGVGKNTLNFSVCSFLSQSPGLEWFSKSPTSNGHLMWC